MGDLGYIEVILEDSIFVFGWRTLIIKFGVFGVVYGAGFFKVRVRVKGAGRLCGGSKAVCC